jgi:Carboxypeptidase regulatory-like domain/TonB dependent receptor
MEFIQGKSASLWIARSAFFLCLALLPGIGPSAHTQVLYGTITGNVTDPSGAVVPNATVDAANTATGVHRSTVSNGSGIYTLEALEPGSHDVTISVSGFAPFKAVGVSVSPNQITRVDAKLTTGAVSQQVVVSAATPVLQTDKADVNYEISSVQLAQIPTTSSEGRNFQALYKFVPGMTPPQEQNSSAGNPMRAEGVNANGVSWVNNSTRIDGATVAYPWLPYLIAYIPPQDAIESVNIVTNSFTADQGTAGGSVINVTIKSGTNQFHGSAFEYNSINQYNARSFFNIQKRPKNIFNEYGGAVGGPIVKNKLFFFADWDRITRRQSISGTQSIPTSQTASGDFTGLTIPGTSNPVLIYDPATGKPDGSGRRTFAQEYGSMKIPASRIDAAAKQMLSLLPAVNNCSSPCTNPINDYFGTGTAAYTLDKIDGKVTYNPNQSNSVFGRYSIAPSDISDPYTLGAAGGSTFDGGQPGNATGRIQSVGLGFTHTFSPTLLLDMNAGYGRQRIGAQAPDISSNYGLNTLQIPGTNGPDPLQGGIPGFIFAGSSSAGFGSGGGTSNGTYSSFGNPNSGSPFLFRDNQYVGNANLSWNKGKHSFRFGGEYTHSAINHFQPQATSNSNLTARGSFIFTGGLTGVPGGATSIYNLLADFLLGLPQNYGKTVQTLNPNAVRWSTFAFYAQDQWQMTPKLTLTYGARYEYYPFANRDHEGVFRFDPSLGLTNNIIVGGKGGNPTSTGVDVGWGMIVPRLGIAYRATERTVIRAGGGMTVDPDNFRTMRDTYGAVTALNPSGSNAFTNANCLQAADAQNSTLGCPVVGIAPIATPNFSTGFLTLPLTATTNTVPKHYRRAYIDSWNLAVEQEFAAGFAGTVSYVGTSAVREVSSVNINAGYPGGGNCGRQLAQLGPNCTGYTADINSTLPFKGANYNGLQAQLTRNVGNNLRTGVAYTWSKAIDYADNSTYNGLTFAYPTYWNRNRALAGYDRTNNTQWWTVSNSPFGKNGSFLKSGFAGKILGGWTLDTALSKVSGTPFSVTDSANTLNAPGNSQVADQVKPTVSIGSVHARGNGSTTGLVPYFDTTAFAHVPTARFGTSARNELRGPGFFNLDTGLARTFPIWESVAFVARIEAFNTTNTPAFANPAANVSAGNFGYTTSVAANTGGRTLNLVGRINF